MGDLQSEGELAENRILADHKRDRKKLIPPLRAIMGDNYSPYSWSRQVVPEVLWIALLHHGLGLRRGFAFALSIVTEADRLCSAIPKPLFSKASSFGALTIDQKETLVENISKYRDYHPAMQALLPFFLVAANSPLSFLKSNNATLNEGSANEVIYELLPKLYDRHSRDSVLCIATAVTAAAKQGKLKVSKDIAKKLETDLVNIEDYPTTEASKLAGSSLRAMAPMLLLTREEHEPKLHEWLEQFWIQIGAFGKCELPFEIQIDEEPQEQFGKTVVRYRNSARTELYHRLKLWQLDLQKIEQREVIGALLARQVTLAVDLADAPTIWTAHAAPVFLRAMADVYIILAWIFGQPEERAKKFFEDGLGAVKLELAHRKEEIKEPGRQNEQSKKIIEYWEDWLASQRIADLVEINLGNWSGTTTRKMAEEAGCVDFYNYVYQPFSNAVHSSWPHVSDKNMVYCLNPTHLNHRLAVSIDYEPSLYWFELAAKYLEKTFTLFDAKTNVVSTVVSAYKQLLVNLESATSEQV